MQIAGSYQNPWMWQSGSHAAAVTATGVPPASAQGAPGSGSAVQQFTAPMQSMTQSGTDASGASSTTPATTATTATTAADAATSTGSTGQVEGHHHGHHHHHHADDADGSSQSLSAADSDDAAERRRQPGQPALGRADLTDQRNWREHGDDGRRHGHGTEHPDDGRRGCDGGADRYVRPCAVARHRRHLRAGF